MTKRDLSVSLSTANIAATLFAGVPVAVLGILFWQLWGIERFALGFAQAIANWWLLILLLLLGITFHEALHALTWVLLGDVGFDQIKFDVAWSTLTPYVHLKVPLPITPYRWAAAMPGLLMGLLPALVALATGNGFLFLVSAFFILAAGGDALIVWLLRHEPATALVEDHPTRAGCYVLSNIES